MRLPCRQLSTHRRPDRLPMPVAAPSAYGEGAREMRRGVDVDQPGADAADLSAAIVVANQRDTRACQLRAARLRVDGAERRCRQGSYAGLVVRWIERGTDTQDIANEVATTYRTNGRGGR